eukprot:1015030-Rhodomonas_salina.2
MRERSARRVRSSLPTRTSALMYSCERRERVRRLLEGGARKEQRLTTRAMTQQQHNARRDAVCNNGMLYAGGAYSVDMRSYTFSPFSSMACERASTRRSTCAKRSRVEARGGDNIGGKNEVRTGEECGVSAVIPKNKKREAQARLLGEREAAERNGGCVEKGADRLRVDSVELAEELELARRVFGEEVSLPL